MSHADHDLSQSDSIDRTIIRLNVGGAIFATSLSTLMRFPDSMLGRMFGGDIPTAKDETGAVFIDRDGEMFRHILNFLRDGDLLLPDPFDDFLRLQREADFFCLDALKEAAAAMENAAHSRQSQRRPYYEIRSQFCPIQSSCSFDLPADFQAHFFDKLDEFGRRHLNAKYDYIDGTRVVFSCSSSRVEEIFKSSGCRKKGDCWYVPDHAVDKLVREPLIYTNLINYG